uniref:Heat shock factor-binding protein 1 n=1 Tax=Zea mays TaxID=4577 RepID=B7ZXJ4_MAIZE|nr:unknown [Zea mays]
MDSDPSSQNPTDMTAFVQNLLGQMQTRFESMSQNIVSKNILICFKFIIFILFVFSRKCEK